MFVRVGDREYPAKHVPQCLTCRSRYRTQIEQGIINGMPYSMIIEQLVEPYDNHSLLGAPSYDGLLRHVRSGHMPVPFSVQRRIIEERGKEIGRSAEQGEQLLVDNIGILRTVVQRGFERLNNGEIQPNMNDLLTALKLQAAVTAEENEGLNEDAYVDALWAYMEIVQRHVSPEVLQRIGDDMARSPTIRALSRRNQTIAGEIET